MYDFIFIYWYQLNVKLVSNDSRFYATSFLTLAIMFHLLLLAAISKYFGLVSLINEAGHSKYYYFPFVVAFIFGIDRLYKKRADSVIEKYAGRQVISWLNTLLVLGLTFAPLVVSIRLLTK
jgi:hypothetical protein